MREMSFSGKKKKKMVENNQVLEEWKQGSEHKQSLNYYRNKEKKNMNISMMDHERQTYYLKLEVGHQKQKTE